MTFHPHLPLIIDSFAGGGGASTGIEMALGRSPDVAINHSAKALALHAANHPETLHLDSNIWDVEPLTVTKGRHVGLLWASPDCKHFSKAKGGAPRDRNIRDLAWVVVKWVEDAKPDVVCMENVEEFVTWGPLGNDGQPIKELAGVTFDLWLKRLRKAGYKVQWRELRACDFGAPTIRKRWFLVARRDGRPIVWPKPTHGDPKSAEVRKGKLLPWVGAHTCIDWSLPCPSILDTGAEIMAKHGLRAVRPLAKNTLARVARGMGRYVIEAERPFLVSLKGTDRRDSPVDAPHPTVLAGGGHSALVVPSIVAPVLTYAQQGGGNRPATDPHHTICAIAASGSHQTPVAAFFAKYYGTGDGARTDDPMHTVTVKDRMAHMQAQLAAPPFAPEHHARARQVAKFLREHGAWDGGEFVTLEIGGASYIVIDIGMRMLTPRELFRAQGFPEDYVIEGVWNQDEDGEWHWQAFAKDVQVSCCGNSVCPPLAAALVRANCQHLAIEQERRMA